MTTGGTNYQVEADAPDVQRVEVGWSRDAHSYYFTVWDLTGRDPNANADGLCHAGGGDGEFPLLFDFLDRTSGIIDWERPANRHVLAQLRDDPWRVERRW